VKRRFSAPLTHRFAAPSPFRRGIRSETFSNFDTPHTVRRATVHNQHPHFIAILSGRADNSWSQVVDHSLSENLHNVWELKWALKNE
jgi:hypothetical protein